MNKCEIKDGVFICSRTPNEEYKPSEIQIAIAFVDYVANAHPNLLPDLIKIDNENKCSWAEGKQKKRMGKRKGASDYLFMRPQIIKKQL